MNRHDTRFAAPAEASLKYEPNNFTVLRHGTFVRCAVTGAAIPIEELRYWSVDRQEAYASRDAALRRIFESAAKES
jgi:hypothetical protein